MTLQSSGAISLNDIHIEVGGSSGTQCSINDSDIRALISKGSGATMSFSEWYGASSFTAETQLVITGGNPQMKFAKPAFSTFTSGIAPGTLGSAADNVITLYQNQPCYFHQVSVSQFMAIAYNLDFNASSNSGGGGMSRTDYLTGKYWRTNFSDGTGNPGNELLGASQAYTLPSQYGNFSGQRLTQNQGGLVLLGDTFNVQRTIQVY